VRQVAELRCLFEEEYFGADGGGSLASWCLGTARRYVADGAYVAEVDGVAQAMVAVEAEVPELTQVGAVYTREAHRGRGLAKAVVSAACREALERRPLVTLTVREGNIPALRAYRALGFQPWIPYRMCRLG
jgi:predicted GNAT family acetyltransferase